MTFDVSDAQDLKMTASIVCANSTDAGKVKAGVSLPSAVLFNGGFHSPMYTAGRAELLEEGLPVTGAADALWTDIWNLVQLYQAALYSDRPDPATVLPLIDRTFAVTPSAGHFC